MKLRQQQQQHPNQQHHQLSLSSSPSNRESAAVKQIGNYLLCKTIGKGTFGKVKLGIHIPTQERVAIKILEKRMIQEEQDKNSVKSEISILKSILHPNISQLYQIIETNECLYLVLEYASNGELFDFIVHKRRLTDQEACLVLAQILNALEYLHNLDICHRDLKPENFLFDHNFELKLVDFGLSKTCEDSNQLLYTCCGSPCYASPETISSQPYIGKYTDLWSCGIILFAMLCGYLPFDDDDQTALFQKIISCEYYIPSDVSPDASLLIKGLLKKDPKQRLSIAQIKNSAFYVNHMQGTQVKQGIKHGIDSIYVDESIIEQLTIFGIEPSFARQSILSNSHNSTTATYYLLQNKFSRNPLLLKRHIQPQIYQRSSNTINNSNQSPSRTIENDPSTTAETIKKRNQSPPKKISHSSHTNSRIPQQVQLTEKQTFSINNQSQENSNQKKKTLLVSNIKIPPSSINSSKKESQQASKIASPLNQKTQYFENQYNLQISQKKKAHNLQQQKSLPQAHSTLLTSSVQIELNNSNEDYYSVGVQQMRHTYENALGNYQNQILSNKSSYIPSSQPEATNLIKAHLSNSANITTITSTSALLQSPIPQQTQPQPINFQQNQQKEQQQEANIITNIPQHFISNKLQSKKTSQIDISSEKYFKSQFKKMKLALQENSLDNAKCVDTTSSPKDLPQYILQDVFSKQNSNNGQINNVQLNLNDSKNEKSPTNFSVTSYTNTSDKPNSNKQKNHFFLQENSKKMDVIKKIIDSVRSTKKTDQNISPRLENQPKSANIDANILFLKRKSVPLYLNSSKQELLSPKNNLQDSILTQSNKQSQQKVLNKNSNTNNNTNNTNINSSNGSLNIKKVNKTSSPSMLFSLSGKQESIEGIKSDREALSQFKKQIPLQQQQQQQSQPLLKCPKDNLLYYPEGISQSNKKTNRLQIIFNKSNSIKKEKALQNNFFHHQNNMTSSPDQTCKTLSNQIEHRINSSTSSSVKGNKNSNQFFYSASKQQQLLTKKQSSKNQAHSVALTIASSSLKTSQGQEEIQNGLRNATNATINSEACISKQALLNNTNSTCADVNYSTIILNECLSDPYRRNDEHKTSSEERQLSLSFYKQNNIQNLVKTTFNSNAINIGKTQVNNLLSIINSSTLKPSSSQASKKEQIQTRNSASSQIKIQNNISQNSVHQIIGKKRITLNMTDNDFLIQQQYPSTTKASITQYKSPIQNNYFMENSQSVKQVQSSSYNNKINSQKRFLFDN